MEIKNKRLQGYGLYHSGGPPLVFRESVECKKKKNIHGLQDRGGEKAVASVSGEG